jgi:hypothetical protein
MKVMLELMQRKAPAAAVILMGITPRTDSAGGASVMPTIDAINERYARFAEGHGFATSTSTRSSREPTVRPARE